MARKNYSIKVSKEQYYVLKGMKEYTSEFFDIPSNYKPTFADVLELFFKNAKPNREMKKVLNQARKDAKEKTKEEAKAKEHEEHLKEISPPEELHSKEEAEGQQNQTSESAE